MKIVADNSKNKYFNSSVKLDDKERNNDFSETLFTFSEGISVIISEFLSQFVENSNDAEVLLQFITDTSKEMVGEFIKSETFKKILDDHKETKLYSWMEDVFKNHLEKIGVSEDEYLEVFRKFDTLDLDVSYQNDQVEIILTNSDGSCKETINRFDSKIDNNELEHKTSESFIVAIILGDKIFGDEMNPIRSLKNTKGFMDGGLINKIRELLRGHN